MLQIREIRLTGEGLPDASVTFGPGPNIVAGESDTGKSYLLHCLDYILGADNLRKRIPEAEPYDTLSVEFENAVGEGLTLVRSLSGGDLTAHRCRLAEIKGKGEAIVNRRRGKSKAPDVTSVLFPFAGIPEAVLRRDKDGKTQRLTIRTFLPTMLVDEVSVIEEHSPVLGTPSFDDTARKRMFAFMLSGKDDSSVIASERKAIVAARLSAKITLIDELLAPLEQRLEGNLTDAEDSIEKLDAAIARASEELLAAGTERASLVEGREVAINRRVRAETQVMAIDQLLTRYQLLSEHYTSDLSRLDFVAEGMHYFEHLQTVVCPLCGQNMDEEHVHTASQNTVAIYAAARAEAAKILAQRDDLENAIASLERRRDEREAERVQADEAIRAVDSRLSNVVQPALATVTERLGRLNARRLEMETRRNANDQADTLRALKAEIEQSTSEASRGAREWEGLPGKALIDFCKEVEKVLKEWKWDGDGRVEFDEKAYDIKVDGQSRQSHGKGVRAVLYSAFVVALLRYCQSRSRPHPGFIVIDSPLTSFKKRGSKRVVGADGPVGAGVEAAFWESLRMVPKEIQIVIVENKEPPADVAQAVQYEWLAGDEAGPGDRIGFIPDHLPETAGPAD